MVRRSAEVVSEFVAMCRFHVCERVVVHGGRGLQRLPPRSDCASTFDFDHS